VLALVLGQLPGDWGFFSSYLSGSVILVVMGIGSTAPGLLQVGRRPGLAQGTWAWFVCVRAWVGWCAVQTARLAVPRIPPPPSTPAAPPPQ
jgi:hypothetical protein